MPHTPLPKITLLKTNSITQCNDKADNLQDKLCGKVKPFMPYTHTHTHICVCLCFSIDALKINPLVSSF